MEESRIKVGESYLVKDGPRSPKLTPVKVVGSGSYRVRLWTGWDVRKLWTGIELDAGRKVTIKDSKRFERKLVTPTIFGGGAVS